eukprot:11786276-Alexandrium_andersonii.AAC.1
MRLTSPGAASLASRRNTSSADSKFRWGSRPPNAWAGTLDRDRADGLEDVLALELLRSRLL